MADSMKMTASALAQLQEDIAELEGPARREIAKRISIAREWGDLKENAEYHAAKDEAAMLEAKIKRMRARLGAAEVVETAIGGGAGMGSTVTYVDEASGKEQQFQLVPAPEADPGKKLLSIDSPMGKALAGAEPGDVRSLETPKGARDLKVVAVDHA
jgi:transcription elongation factor GreA